VGLTEGGTCTTIPILALLPKWGDVSDGLNLKIMHSSTALTAVPIGHLQLT